MIELLGLKISMETPGIFKFFWKFDLSLHGPV
jgi:hypothetical protein